MIHSILISIGGITGILLLWVGVQQLWRKTFSEYVRDEDVLADRRSCSNCGCTTACENRATDKNTFL